MMVTTGEALDILNNSASVTGNIVDIGEGALQHGHCYGVVPGVSVDHNKTSLGKPGNLGEYTSDLKDLASGTKYYIKAYISDGSTTIYGDEISFSTNPDVVLPEVSTAAVSDILTTSASGGGIVTSDGYGTVTTRGVCWSIAENPTITDSKTEESGGTGTFSSPITGLNPGTTYYVKAYATNSAGTAYGEQVHFTTNFEVVLPSVTTTEITNITTITASGGGNVISSGHGTVTARGVCWGTSLNPTIADSKTMDGEGSGLFSSTIFGLDPGTTYYVKAYATNSAGTAYGDQRQFTTDFAVELPTISTDDITNITTVAATGGGNVTSDGYDNVTARGVCWSTGQNPTVNDSRTVDGTGTGTFVSSITGLNPQTTYYVRAYATNSVGTAYGNQKEFSTGLEISLPVVTTSSVTSITTGFAYSGGDVIDNGNASVTDRGICWSTSPGPTTDNSKISLGTGMGEFASYITNLIDGTTYFLRAYAINSEGTGYGEEKQFATVEAGFESSDYTDSRDGKVYPTLQIGNQRWMAENLAYLPEIGTSLPSTAPKYHVKFFSGTNVNEAKATTEYQTFGVLYNWPAAMLSCPTGWSLPSEAEWDVLQNYLINNGYNYDGSPEGNKIGKALATSSGWLLTANSGAVGRADYPHKRNATGFSALPANTGNLITGNIGAFWTADEVDITKSFYRMLAYTISYLRSGESVGKGEFMTIRCIEGNKTFKPIISTLAIGDADYDKHSVSAAVLVSADGGEPVTEWGFYISNSANAETTGTKHAGGSGTGTFTHTITGLTPGTLYYIRAYATNTVGTGYGEERIFRTLPEESGAFTDPRDGTQYKTILIGDQIWMAQHLAYLPSVYPPTSGSFSAERYYVLGYNGTDVGEARATNSYQEYGVLYNWVAASNACPAGWHLPSDTEWLTMINYLIANGYNYDGTTSGNKIGKALAELRGWSSHINQGAVGNSDYPEKRNLSGFSALPGDSRTDSNGGSFTGTAYTNNLWTATSSSSTDAYYHRIETPRADIKVYTVAKSNGFSVRCIKDY